MYCIPILAIEECPTMKCDFLFLQFWKIVNSCCRRCNSGGSACHAGLANVDQNANISSDAPLLLLIQDVL